MSSNMLCGLFSPEVEPLGLDSEGVIVVPGPWADETEIVVVMSGGGGGSDGEDRAEQPNDFL